MISLDDALDHVLARCEPLAPSSVATSDARGLVLAEPVVANESVPPFDNTAMDGFAVRAVDTSEAPVDLEIVGTIPAGAAPTLTVGDGQAARIMTGAPMPSGADAVVMVERTEVIDPSTVRVDVVVGPGNHVRRAGDDIVPGDVVFEAGEVVTAGHVGVLASLGIEEVVVGPRARVGVMSTGDELVDGPRPLEPGQIRDSNRHTLLAMVDDLGLEGIDLGLVADTEADIESALRAATERCDAIITSGGVSMGDFDYVKTVLDRIGAMRWMQVAIKPAKPLAFGTIGRTPVFGLPGNPVSSMVSFTLFAEPGLAKLTGRPHGHDRSVPAIAVTRLDRHADGKTHFMRVVARRGEDGRWSVESAGGQGSHQLSAMARANALAILPDGEGIPAGAPVRILLLGETLV